MSSSVSPRMDPDRKKILEVILFLLEEGERRGLLLTQYDIVKSMFLADKKHLAATEWKTQTPEKAV